MRYIRNDLRTTHIDPLIRVDEPAPQLLISEPRLTTAEAAAFAKEFERLSGKPAHWEPAVTSDPPKKLPKRRGGREQ